MVANWIKRDYRIGLEIANVKGSPLSNEEKSQSINLLEASRNPYDCSVELGDAMCEFIPKGLVIPYLAGALGALAGYFLPENNHALYASIVGGVASMASIPASIGALYLKNIRARSLYEPIIAARIEKKLITQQVKKQVTREVPQGELEEVVLC